MNRFPHTHKNRFSGRSLYMDRIRCELNYARITSNIIPIFFSKKTTYSHFSVATKYYRVICIDVIHAIYMGKIYNSYD